MEGKTEKLRHHPRLPHFPQGDTNSSGSSSSFRMTVIYDGDVPFLNVKPGTLDGASWIRPGCHVWTTSDHELHAEGECHQKGNRISSQVLRARGVTCHYNNVPHSQ